MKEKIELLINEIAIPKFNELKKIEFNGASLEKYTATALIFDNHDLYNLFSDIFLKEKITNYLNLNLESLKKAPMKGPIEIFFTVYEIYDKIGFIFGIQNKKAYKESLKC